MKIYLEYDPDKEIATCRVHGEKLVLSAPTLQGIQHFVIKLRPQGDLEYFGVEYQ